MNKKTARFSSRYETNEHILEDIATLHSWYLINFNDTSALILNICTISWEDISELKQREAEPRLLDSLQFGY